MELVEQTVTLPVCKKEAVIREGNGYSDRALLKKNKLMFQVIPDYIASMTVSIDGKGVDRNRILDLPTPDQEFLAIEIYKLNYGDIFDLEFECPSCGHPQEAEININELPLTPAPEPPEVSGVLPRSKMAYTVGILNGHKEQNLFAQMANGKFDLNQADFECLLSFDGRVDFSFEDIIALPLADHKAIRKARKKLVCGYNTNITIACTDCDMTDSFNLLMNPDFLLPGG